MVLMALTPEALLEPGFQMSFAATAALIAAFGALERAVLRERLHPWAIPLFTLVLSSVVAGAATAPFAAAHFNRFAAYGLIANLLTVPVMGAVIMPAGAVAALLCPLGLGAPAYWAMEAGSAWILWVAHWIAALDGAVVAVPAPPAGVIGLAGLALAALVIGPGRWRWAGAAPAMAALALWLALPRPEVLISADGRLVGVLGPEGRALSAPRGAGFAAGNWLQNDGDLAAQAVAAARPGIGPGGRFLLAGRPAAAVRRAEEVAQACAEGRVVILGAPAPAPAPAAAWPAGCAVIGPEVLARTGPVAIAAGGEIRVTRTARRLWSPSPAEDAALAPLAAALAGPPPAGSRLARAGPGRPERGRPSGAANAVCDAKRAPPACP
jgi:competence protein ComEC